MSRSSPPSSRPVATAGGRQFAGNPGVQPSGDDTGARVVMSGGLTALGNLPVADGPVADPAPAGSNTRDGADPRPRTTPVPRRRRLHRRRNEAHERRAVGEPASAASRSP